MVLPFRIYGRAWLYQEPSPAAVQLKVESVGVQLEVVSPGLYEEPGLDLTLEDDHVEVERLSELSHRVHLGLGHGEVVGLVRGWLNMVLL